MPTPTLFVIIYQYSAYQKQIKAWIEINRSRRCHVNQVILVASIAVAPTPGGESARASFFVESRAC